MRSLRVLLLMLAVAGCVLILASAALAQDQAPMASARYVLKPVVETSQNTTPAPSAWQVRGDASGRGYRLQAVNVPPSSEAPCCCLYMPCVKEK
jgi:hypothetical protein